MRPRPALRRALAPVVVDAIERLVSKVPASHEIESDRPGARARALRDAAARKAATISGAMALPPGPLGLLSLVPDLKMIWKVQSQLVADVARVYGKTGTLTREAMVYCLFKHGGAALLRDLVVRAGERLVVQRAGLRVLEDVLAKIGLRVSRGVLGRAASRWVPVLGVAGVGAYAYFDTKKVGDTAIELFSQDVVVADSAA
jgi:hypothetical protein